jgi:hypothetical protein
MCIAAPVKETNAITMGGGNPFQNQRLADKYNFNKISRFVA